MVAKNTFDGIVQLNTFLKLSILFNIDAITFCIYFTLSGIFHMADIVPPDF